MSTRVYSENEEEDDGSNACRRRNEIELILAAYTREEVWLEPSNDGHHDQSTEEHQFANDYAMHEDQRRNHPILVRKLRIHHQNNDEADGNSSIMTAAALTVSGVVVDLELRLCMPPLYPADEALHVQSFSVVSHQNQGFDADTCGEDAARQRSCQQRILTKRVYDLIPELERCCRDAAQSSLGAESIWTVLVAADGWLEANCHKFFQFSSEHRRKPSCDRDQDDTGGSPTWTLDMNGKEVASTLLVGRRLIYSHHIIAKSKRSDLASLFGELDLTGYVKVGWPGVILIEGPEESCAQFFEAIRRWSWQHLAVRGEMRQPVELLDGGQGRRFRRLLPPYSEVDELSVISRHCQQVGLEPLFRTLLKGQGATASRDEEEDDKVRSEADQERLYGALLHVDHMNDGRSYRKRVTKLCRQLDVCVAIMEVTWSVSVVQTSASTKEISTMAGARRIVAALVGDESGVRGALKKWRTSRVDVDARGRPCMERMLAVLQESPIDRSKALHRLDWDSLSTEECLRMSMEDASSIVSSIGGPLWVESLAALFSAR